jgi:hypothetical protein
VPLLLNPGRNPKSPSLSKAAAGFSQGYPRLVPNVFQGYPSLPKVILEKKDCLFFMGGAGRDGPCCQINPLTNQILADTGQKMNRTAKLRGQNTYCQFRFSCYYLRSLPSNGGREKRPQISRLSECGAATITSNYNPVFRGMLCENSRGFNQRKNCD